MSCQQETRFTSYSIKRIGFLPRPVRATPAKAPKPEPPFLIWVLSPVFVGPTFYFHHGAVERRCGRAVACATRAAHAVDAAWQSACIAEQRLAWGSSWRGAEHRCARAAAHMGEQLVRRSDSRGGGECWPEKGFRAWRSDLADIHASTAGTSIGEAGGEVAAEAGRRERSCAACFPAGTGRKRRMGAVGVSPHSPTIMGSRGWIWVPTPNWRL